MSIRSSLVIVCTCFIIGTLATHFVADSLTLWQSAASEEALYSAAQYYVLLSQAPRGMVYFLGGSVVLGASLILWNIFDGNAGNLMFDGGSLFLYASATAVYIYQVIPTIVDNFSKAPISVTAKPAGTFPSYLQKPTLDLASSHLVCSVAMTGVIFLQAGKWWADREDREAKAPTPAGPPKVAKRKGTGKKKD